MKIIFINDKICPKEKILKFLSNEQDNSSNSQGTLEKSEDIFLYNSPHNIEDLLKEINLDSLIGRDGSDRTPGNEYVIVINHENNYGDESTEKSDKIQSSDNIIEYKNIRMDLQYREVFINKKRVILTSFEYKLLLFFVSNYGKIIEKSALIKYLWGTANNQSDPESSIYTHMKNLKKKLMISGAGNYIHNIYGQGYKFEDLEETVL